MVETDVPAVLMPAEAGAGHRALDYELLDEQVRRPTEQGRCDVPNLGSEDEGGEGWKVLVPQPQESAVGTPTDVVQPPTAVVDRLRQQYVCGRRQHGEVVLGDGLRQQAETLSLERCVLGRRDRAIPRMGRRHEPRHHQRPIEANGTASGIGGMAAVERVIVRLSIANLR
ncbi:MAG: hypothetical protein AAF547_12395 [Actinomycetota bacterium]